MGSIGAITGFFVALEWMRLRPATPAQFLYIALLAIALVPLAILVLSTAVYLAAPPRPLPRASLSEQPRVAILYAVFNDVLPQAIEHTLRNLGYPQAEVWLLSDSTRPDALAVETALPSSVRVFRRPDRRGGKAGAINDWMHAEGSRFRYVVPMDADAILKEGSLQSLLAVAEHPANRRYAGFQSLMEVHPALAPSAFARILGRGVKWGSRIIPLANQRIFGQGMYWGSNALLRADAIRAAGGWVEDNICEDFALTARLDSAGLPIALVDVYNYEGFPPDALSFRERTTRWVRANMSVAPSVIRARTSFAVRLGVAIPLLFYLMAPTLLGLLLLSLVSPPELPPYRFGSVIGLSLLAFVFTYRLAIVPRTMLSLRAFAVTVAAETVVVLGMALRVTWALLKSLAGRPTWTPSRKRALRLSPAAAVRASVPELTFGISLVTMAALVQPPFIYVLLASVWLLSFLSTPVILWSSGRFAAGRPLHTLPAQASVPNAQ